MSIEAMKQALEALEAGDWYIGQLEPFVYSPDDTATHEERAKVQTTIAALRTAIAETESRATEQAEEPVAWTDENFTEIFVSQDIAEDMGAVVPLYTTPPAAQPAAPLTDAQRRAIIAKLSEADYADGDEWDNALFDAIEAAHGITAQASEKGQP
mgnify:CR=1 FL=1